MVASGLDIGGIEYLHAPHGRMMFYDINANSNLRAPIARALGLIRLIESLTSLWLRSQM